MAQEDSRHPLPTVEILSSAKANESDPALRPKDREILFALLEREPKHATARLQLAKLFYLDGLFSFARKEVEELRRFVHSQSLDKLFTALGGELSAGGPLSPEGDVATNHSQSHLAGNAENKPTIEEETVSAFDIDLDLDE